MGYYYSVSDGTGRTSNTSIWDILLRYYRERLICLIIDMVSLLLGFLLKFSYFGKFHFFYEKSKTKCNVDFF